MKKNEPLKICNTVINPGEKISLALPTPEIYTCIPMHIPIHVMHGKKRGPVLLICAALHGDEVNGVAIIQKLLKLDILKKLHGTLIAIPVVNVYSLLSQTRNLPDHRDLEKNFPGSDSGTYAARLAHTLNNDIFSLATHFIDLHTAESYKKTVPQIITDLTYPDAYNMARAFQSHVIIHSDSSEGMMQKMHDSDKKPLLLYKAGEANRLNDPSIRIGVYGIVKVMRYLNMLPVEKSMKKSFVSKIVKSNRWVLSPGSGLCKIKVKTGVQVKKNDVMATISDPFGTKQKYKIISPIDGIILTTNNYPLVNEGDEIIELAKIHSKKGDEAQFMPWSVEKDESIT